MEKLEIFDLTKCTLRSWLSVIDSMSLRTPREVCPCVCACAYVFARKSKIHSMTGHPHHMQAY